RENGYGRENLRLLELAYSRHDSDERGEREEISYLLDLQSGEVYKAIAYRPYRGMDKIPGQSSYAQPLRIGDTVLYPGSNGRRIRWEKAAEQTEPLEPVHLQTAYALARPEFESAVAAYRQSLKNMFDPSGNTFLLRCASIGLV